MSSNTFIGTVGSDIRKATTGENQPVASFRLAVNERRFDQKSGQWIDGPTSWFTVVTFRNLARNVAASLVKGQRVIVQGQLRVSEWERDGKSGTNVEILASDLGHSLMFGTSEFVTGVRPDLAELSLVAAGATEPSED